MAYTLRMSESAPSACSIACGDCNDLFTSPEVRERILSEAGYEWRRTRRDLNASYVRTGCPLCGSMDEINRLSPGWDLQGRFGDRELIFTLKAYSSDGREGISRLQWTTQKGFERYFDLFTTSDDIAATFVYERPINEEASSGASFVQAKKWMQECHKSHEACRTSSQPSLPTRVLDVSPESKSSVRVHMTSGGSGAYAALSYCWGCPQPSKLTAAVLKDYCREIPFNKLPRTIRDAICVTRGLGLKYLWIDSLCIIQDNEDDKETEISRMQDIYKNSHITILASRAFDCEEGFLHPLPTDSSRPVMKLPFRCPGGENGNLFLREERNRHWGTNGIVDPINDRAWCLQEYLLAPRALIYSSAQLFWRCRSEFHRDGGNLSRKGFHDMSSLTDFQLPGQNSLEFPVDSSRDSLKLWHTLLLDYTQRKLTDESDRLSALSGIVTELSKFMGSYLAGLWEKCLLYDLMWYSPHVLPRTGLVPSWSWASVSGACQNTVMRPLEIVEVANLIHFEIKLYRDDAPFGRVKEGKLWLEGRLKRVHLSPNHDDGGGGAEIVQEEEARHLTLATPGRASKSKTATVAGTCYFDMDDHEPLELYPSSEGRHLTINDLYKATVPKWCIPLIVGIGLRSFGDPPEPMGLLLTRAGNDSYQRIGVFFGASGKSEFFMSEVRQIIAIV